jgi:hypothetical protein
MKKFFLTAVLLLAAAPLVLADMPNVSITRVIPKVFAPDSSAGANRVRFELNNPDNRGVSIRIFDMAGN